MVWVSFSSFQKRPSPIPMDTPSLTQGCAVASSGQCTGVTVGQHGHLAAPRGCPLQEVMSSQVPNSPIVPEVLLQHVLSIADHSGANKRLSASGPELAHSSCATLLLKDSHSCEAWTLLPLPPVTPFTHATHVN